MIQIHSYSHLLNRTGVTVMPGIHHGNQKQSETRHLNLLLTNISKEPVQLLPYTIVALITSFHENDLIHSNLQDISSKELKNMEINNMETTPKPNINEQLTPDQRLQIDKMLNEFKDLFTVNNEPSQTSKVVHRIDVEDSKPINSPPARHGFKEREYIEAQVADMKSKGIIQDSRSPWASRVVLVKKKDGGLRFCVDYRALNNITIKDVYPLPRIDDSLSILKQGSFFTTLDMFSGYWQIPMEEQSRDKTAFVTNSGLYEFLVMPFELTNAPAIFQRFMDATLAGLKWRNLVVYLDDIVIFSPTFEQHLEDLKETFQRLKDANLKLKSSKCYICQRRINYLGHVISENGIEPCRDKIEAILQMKKPSNKNELRTWLGMFGYYQNFVENFA